jgi:hypothetical protein
MSRKFNFLTVASSIFNLCKFVIHV